MQDEQVAPFVLEHLKLRDHLDVTDQDEDPVPRIGTELIGELILRKRRSAECRGIAERERTPMPRPPVTT